MSRRAVRWIHRFVTGATAAGASPTVYSMSNVGPSPSPFTPRTLTANTPAAVGDPLYRGRVDAMGDEARRVGVTGIPTFVMGHHGVVGCQPYEVIAALAESEGATRR